MSNHHKESQRSFISGDTVFLFLIFVFFAVFFILTLSMGATAGRVPKLITGIGLALCVIQLIPSFRGKTSKGKEEKGKEDLKGISVYKMFLSIIAYIIGLQVLGFIITTFAYLLCVPRVMQYKNWKAIGVFSVLATIILSYSFAQFFQVRLPEGILFSMF